MLREKEQQPATCRIGTSSNQQRELQKLFAALLVISTAMTHVPTTTEMLMCSNVAECVRRASPENLQVLLKGGNLKVD